MNKSRVLFLCTGNSCRSQMAEEIVNHRLGDSWEAFSAGSRPAGYVHPFAIKVLSEIGIEHHGHSKSIAEFTGQSFDQIITLCDDSDEDCPVWLGQGKVIHHPYPDPAKTPGGKSEKLAAFRKVRDEIVEDLGRILTN